jgi:tryptophan synthase alpha chain
MDANPYAQALKKKGKPLFIPFVVLGDPNRKQCMDTIRLLIENGADALELGFPFSDPPADGPVIQAADNRALSAGIRISDCFEMLKEIRTFTDIPIGLLVYYNLVLQRGVEKFYRDCAASGVSSVLIADLPLEHAGDVVPIAKQHGIAPVFLVSAVTTDERLECIAEIADGYLYVVSYLGVTGVSDSVREEALRHVIGKARRHTQLPLFAGFGISTAAAAKAATASGADGIIVGSRIVQAIGNAETVKRICREICGSLR